MKYVGKIVARKLSFRRYVYFPAKRGRTWVSFYQEWNRITPRKEAKRAMIKKLREGYTE